MKKQQADSIYLYSLEVYDGLESKFTEITELKSVAKIVEYGRYASAMTLALKEIYRKIEAIINTDISLTLISEDGETIVVKELPEGVKKISFNTEKYNGEIKVSLVSRSLGRKSQVSLKGMK